MLQKLQPGGVLLHRGQGGCRVLPPAVCPAAAAAAHGGCRGSSAPAALPSQPSTTLSTACSPLSGRAGHGGRRLGVAVAAAPAGGAGLEPQQQPGPGQGVAAGAAAGGVAGAAPAAAPRDLSLEPFKALVAGRSFMCTMCGKCCTGEGEIWLAPEEVTRIAKHLNMSTQRFLDTHCKQYSKYKGWRMLKTREDSSACIFLGADNKCSIHTVRPNQCSTYPWWPELTEDAEWDWERENVCEGFDHPEAPPLDVEEAARQLREANKMTQLRLLASTARTTQREAEWAEAVVRWDDLIGKKPYQKS